MGIFLGKWGALEWLTDWDLSCMAGPLEGQRLRNDSKG